MAAGEPDTLYQQNHCGVYRSADGGRSWEDISAGLVVRVRVRHGRPPARSATGWVIPLTPSGGGPPVARTARWRSGGPAIAAIPGSGTATGLPQKDTFVGVLREALAVDRSDPAGVYFGTSTGSSTARSTRASAGQLVADHLPADLGVEAVVVD